MAVHRDRETGVVVLEYASEGRVVRTGAHYSNRYISHEQLPSLSTIWRVVRREGLVVPTPQKCPRCSLIRFEADLPNEMWQADITAWSLAGGEVVEILNLIDDHSRLFLVRPTGHRSLTLTRAGGPAGA